MNAREKAARIVWAAAVVLYAITATAAEPNSLPAKKSAAPAANQASQPEKPPAAKNVFPKYVLEVIDKTGHAGIEREIRDGGNRILQGTEPMSPKLLINYLADSLDRAGIDKETAKSHLLAVFAKGFFFKDQCIEAEAALVARYPELAGWVKEREKARNPLVVGQIRAFLLAFEYTDDEPRLAKEVGLVFSSFVFPSEAEKTGVYLQRSEVTVDMYFDGAATPVKQTVIRSFRSTPTPAIHSANVPLHLPDSVKSVKMRIDWSVRPSARGVRHTKPETSHCWYQVDRRKEGGFDTVMLGDDGRPLAYPHFPATAERVFGYLSARGPSAGEKLFSSLPGTKLKSLALAAHPGREPWAESWKLDLPQKGLVALEIGATWCGPCRMIDKDVVAVAEKLNKQGIRVIRLSVDHKPAKYLEALKTYTGGVLTDKQDDSLHIHSVPCVIVLKDGTITKVASGTKGVVETLQGLLAEPAGPAETP
jgi:thiol-disulfide isomerase/thioredoxin